ncbi:site-specific integrase [Paranoxybacillus vitaminiphilus]|uniref:site-specific integrase n=1 Tax=Paranoxybacillus vitaminiphilus TaxID=581036 RepID=UPI001FE39BC9|nr:site-specific integrase [Anoxybacillus vitaminiphilus]
MLTKYADLANRENITPHRFRHSFSKNLANAGTSIELDGLLGMKAFKQRLFM